MSLPNCVLFLCDYAAPYGGNFIPSMKALEQALRLRGCRSVYCFPASVKERAWCEELIAGGSTVAFFDRDAGFFKIARQIGRIVRTERAGLIHAHFGQFSQALLQGLLHPRLSIVLHVHSDFSAGRALPLRRRLGRAFLHAAEAAMGRRVTRICVGAHMCAGRKNAVFVPNAIVFGRGDAAPGREDARARLGVSEDVKLVLLFGWSPYIKGVDVAVRAVGRLAAKRFVLAVVTGREMDGEALSAWLAAQPGCGDASDSLLLLPPTEDVYAYHHAADVMLSASRSETFSYALAEAIDALRPCVTSDIPGTRWASAYETVERFPSGDDEACANALLRAAKGYPEQTLAAMRARLQADCAIDRWVAGVLSVYERGT